jgi:uncharacterized protein
MKELRFVWDPQKAETTKKDHQVSFEEARTVFYDANARLRYDPEQSEHEERFILSGVSASLRILVVCHCYRESETLIRIISARKATLTERNQYEKFLP